MYISDPVHLLNCILPYHTCVVENDYRQLGELFSKDADLIVLSDASGDRNKHKVDFLDEMAKKWSEQVVGLNVSLEKLSFFKEGDALGVFRATYKMQGVLAFRPKNDTRASGSFTLRFEDTVALNCAGKIRRIERAPNYKELSVSLC